MAKFNDDNFREFYSWDKFQDLSPKEREQLIRLTVEHVGMEKGLKQINLKFKSMEPGSRGSCSQNFGLFNQLKGHDVELNKDILTTTVPYEVYQTYSTINHELEHADQYEKAANKEISNSDASVLEQRLNDEHYYKSSANRFDEKTDHQFYRAQACESEARAAGLQAVKELRAINISNGINDRYADEYIEYAEAVELKNNRIMLEKLGMHSRENMALEQLNRDSMAKVNDSDRENVIQYARQKDYEIAKAVLNEDSNNTLSEEQVKDAFANNKGYRDFFKTVTYDVVKAQEGDYNKVSRYKWSEESSRKSLESKREEFTKIMNNEDNPTGNLRDRVIHPSFGQTAKILKNGHEVFFAEKKGYKTPTGYKVGEGVKLVNSLSSPTPGQVAIDKQVLDDNVHAFDELYANKHPEEKFDFRTPTAVSQDIIDKHTFVVGSKDEIVGEKPTVDKRIEMFRESMSKGAQSPHSNSEKKEAFSKHITEGTVYNTNKNQSNTKGAENKVN